MYLNSFFFNISPIYIIIFGMKKFYEKRIDPFLENLKEDKIDVHTGQTSFFMVLSVFPFLLLMLNIVSIIPSGRDVFIKIINTVSNNSIKDLLHDLINYLSHYASGFTISISAIIALWSASKGVHTLMQGLSNINNLHKNRHFIVSRLLSMVYTLAFIILVLITMCVLIFGNKSAKYIIGQSPHLDGASYLSMTFRYLAMFVFFLLFFLAVYRLSNRKYASFKKIFWGALFSAAGWILFSLGFNIYIDYFFNTSYMYGSLASFVVLMLWTYACIYIFFIGHEINKLLHPEIVAPDEDESED